MKLLLAFAAGIVAGFIVAHQVNQNPNGRQFFEQIDRKARAFSGAVADGYHARDAELRADANVNR